MDLLAIVAHPDDAGIFCGGTLAKHADRGDTVTVAHMTRGEYGGFEQSEDEIAATRTEEALAAGDVLGVENVEFLGFQDGRIEYTLENRMRIVEAMREHEPDLVLTHFGDDMHPDHCRTSQLVSDAYYMAGLPKVETGQEPADPDNVYFFGKPTSAFEPSVFVDVGDYLETKIQAVAQHESQIEYLQDHGGIDAEFDNLLDSLRAEARSLGTRASAPAAEGFAPLHEQPTAYLG